MKNAYLVPIIDRFEQVSAEMQTYFQGLSEVQLNWKPNPEKWSIAQCLDHLIVSNQTYFPVLREHVEGKHRKTFVEKLPFWAAMGSSLMIRFVQPEPAMKMKSPSVFQPTSSTVKGDIVDRFLEHNQALIALFQEADQLERHEKIVITSPAASFLTYTLRATAEVLANHEERHFKQALQVLQDDHFPA